MRYEPPPLFLIGELDRPSPSGTSLEGTFSYSLPPLSRERARHMAEALLAPCNFPPARKSQAPRP